VPLLCTNVVINFSDNPIATGWERRCGHGKDWQWENGGVSYPNVWASKGSLFSRNTSAYFVTHSRTFSADFEVYEGGEYVLFYCCFIITRYGRSSSVSNV